MSLWKFLLTGCLVFLFLHYFAVPIALKAVPAATGATVLRRAATLAVVTSLRSIAMIVTGATALLATLVFALSEFAGRGDSTLFTVPLSFLRGAKNMVGSIEPSLGFVGAFILAWMLIRASRRSARAAATKQLELVQKEQVDSLIEQAQAGTLEPIAPTDLMSELSSKYDQILATREALAAAIADGGITAEEGTLFDHDLWEQLEAVQSEYARHDILRRVELKITNAEVQEAPASTWWGRVKEIAASEGMLTTLDGSSKALRTISLALMVPALLSANAPSFGAVLEERISRVAELRIEARAADATKDWPKALAALPEAAPDEPAVPDSVIDLIARTFEDGVFHAVLAGRRIGPPLQSALVRRRMIAAAAPQAGSAKNAVPLASQSADEAAIEKAMVTSDRGPRTPLGERYRDELRTELDKSPRLRAKLRRYGQSFARPATTDDVARALLKQTLGFVTEGVKPSGELLGVVYDGVASSVDPSELRTSAHTLMAEHRVHLAKAASLDEVTEWLTHTDSKARWTPGMAKGLNQVISEKMPTAVFEFEYRPPSMASAAPRGANVEAAAKSIVELAQEGGASSAARTERLTEALADFDDYFPSGVESEAATSRASLLRELHPNDYAVVDRSKLRIDPSGGVVLDAAETGASGGGGAFGPGGGGAGPEGGRAARALPPSRARTRPVALSMGTASRANTFANVARARSFARLRGFSRIGGVVFGREPNGGTSIDARGLNFRRVGTQIEISLRDRSNRVITVGTFQASLLHRALLYAADGRLTAVTMVTASPLAELKILAHPAIVDTEIGCELIELDRFVDIYTGRTDRRQAAMQILDAIHALYRLAWSEQMVAGVTPSLLARVDTSARSYLVHQRDIARRTLDQAESSRQAKVGLRLPDSLFTSRYSPAFDKSQYYDMRISGLVRTCARPASDMLEFLRCVRAKQPEVDAETTMQLATAMPSYRVWSGVREQEYNMDQNLMSLRKPSSLGSPLRFMLQVSFTSPANESAGSDEGDPFEFPAIASWLETSVRSEVRNPGNTFHQRVLADAEEFVIAQRFARAALNGDLGDHFPLERLVELTTATRPDGARSFSTPRWNVRDGALQTMLVSDLEAAAEQLKGGTRVATAMKCARAMQTPSALADQVMPLAVCSRVADKSFAEEAGTEEEKEAVLFMQARLVETQHAIAVRKSLVKGLSANQGGRCPTH